MSDSVKLILSLSISGSILTVIYFSIKPLIRNRVSKAIQYYVLLLILVRLLIPFSFGISLTNIVFNPSDSGTAGIPSSHITTESPHSKAIGSDLETQKRPDAIYYSNTKNLNNVLGRTILPVWILGIIILLGINIISYLRFVSKLTLNSKEASIEEYELLRRLGPGKSNVKLLHSRFVLTPMLIGIFSPKIIIPDIDFTPKQLENVLHHELIHLKRLDIAVKWFTLFVTSLHWFNPLMLLIRREMNRVCELSCDEAVIKHLDADERQIYGETLITVASERKYSIGVLAATMCEEKRLLKERLSAIMKYDKKTVFTIALSVLLLIAFIGGAATLGTGFLGRSNVSAAVPKPVVEVNYNLPEIAKHRTNFIGNNSKVMALVANLPLPDTYYEQQYISLKTKEKPYGLTIYYEAAKNMKINNGPITSSGSKFQSALIQNALVLFCMIDNMEHVTFAFRNSKSNGDLDKASYDKSFMFTRESIESQYGDLSLLSSDLSELAIKLNRLYNDKNAELLISEAVDSKGKMPSRIKKLLDTIVSSPKTSSDPGDYIRTHQSECSEIIAMGKDSLPYLASLADKSANRLRERIAALLTKDILNNLENGK